jgi:3-dehydroquinate dehydratase, type II
MKIGVMNGPNLDRLGKREPGIYGRQTLTDILDHLRKKSTSAQAELVDFQSASEGLLVDKIHEWTDQHLDGLLINAGALSHTSISLHDAIKASSFPAIEVHLSHVHGREEFRHHSMIAPACVGFVSGFGPKSYELALEGLLTMIQQKDRT